MIDLTPTTFRARLRALGHSITSFAALTGVHRVRATKWGVPDADRANDFPTWVGVLLEALERGKKRGKIAAE